MALSIGDRLGHYDVTALIGEAGMAGCSVHTQILDRTPTRVGSGPSPSRRCTSNKQKGAHDGRKEWQEGQGQA